MFHVNFEINQFCYSFVPNCRGGVKLQILWKNLKFIYLL